MTPSEQIRHIKLFQEMVGVIDFLDDNGEP